MLNNVTIIYIYIAPYIFLFMMISPIFCVLLLCWHHQLWEHLSHAAKGASIQILPAGLLAEHASDEYWGHLHLLILIHSGGEKN